VGLVLGLDDLRTAKPVFGRLGERLFLFRIVVLFLAMLGPQAASDAGSKLDSSCSFAIRWWTVEDGLPEIPLTAIDLAPDESVWCATRTRLARFDGQVFDVLASAVTDPIHRQIGDFVGMGFDATGTLWLVGKRGVAARSGSAATPIGGDWTICPLASGTSTAAGPLDQVIFDRKGDPRFIGLNRFLRCDGLRFVEAEGPRGPDPFRYYAACIDTRTDDVWVWGFGSARRIMEGQPHDDAAEFTGKIINLAPGRHGIWAGLVDRKAGTVEGAALFQDGRWTKWPMPQRVATPAREGHVAEAADGTLLLSTHASIHALRDGRWQTVVDGLPGFSLTTQRMKASRQGTVWSACSGGLLAIDPTKLRASPLPPACVLHRRRDGSLLAGIPGAIVTLDERADTAATRGETVASLPDGVVPTAMAEQADGTLFVGTRDSFIYRVRDGQVKVVTQTQGSRLEVRNVYALACDADDRIWVGTDNGLAVYDPARFCFTTLPAFTDPTPLPVIGLAAEDDGSLLVAVRGVGIDRLMADGPVRHEVSAGLMPGRRAVHFCRTSDRTVWAAGDLGLLRLGADGRMKLFDERQGLADRSLVAVAADDWGRLWLACRDGRLQAIRLADLDAAASEEAGVVRGVVLGPLDGLGETELLGGLARTADGGLLATTATGIVQVDPLSQSPATKAPAMAFSVLEQDTHRGIELRYSAVTTDEFERPLYQTRLVGVDAAWSVPGPERTRTYSAIPPGRHRFEVRQLRGDTMDDFPVGSIDVVVPTPYWRTPWFVAASLCAVAGLGAAVAWWAGRAAARRRITLLEREQERQRDRARIARDIHDSLGAGLTQMAMMSDLMRRAAAGPRESALDEKLDEMYRSAQNLTRAVDEIVWAVNPANDTLRRFCTFVAHDVEDMARSGGLDLRVDVDDEVPEVVLPASSRHHLCMLVREAVANVLKHARATTLDFSLHVRDGRLEMVIADDGQGFARDYVIGDDQDGLANMQARAEELGGVVEIASTPSRGTRVSVRVPFVAANGQVNEARRTG